MKYLNILLDACKLNSLPQEQVENIKNIISENKINSYEFRFILDCINHDNCENIISQFYEYKSLPANEKKKNTIKMYTLRYGKFAKEKYETKNKKCLINKNLYIKKYGKDADRKYNELKQKKAITLQNLQQKYGIEEGRIRYEHFCNRNKGNHSLERKIEKHGIEKGTELFHKSRNRLKYIHSLAGYIEIFGEKEGTERYYNKINKLNLASKKGYSNISQDLFWTIIENLKGNYLKNIKFEKCNGEAFINKYKIDFIDLKQNKIIEFFGDRFHANPLLFHENDCPNPFRNDLKASNIWKHDKEKIEYLRNAGYSVLVIWELQMKESFDKTVNECKQFLNYE